MIVHTRKSGQLRDILFSNLTRKQQNLDHATTIALCVYACTTVSQTTKKVG